MDKILIEMLGRNAFEGNMQVAPDMIKLVKAIRYMKTQLEITKRWCDDEGKQHIDEVIENVKEILMTN